MPYVQLACVAALIFCSVFYVDVSAMVFICFTALIEGCV